MKIKTLIVFLSLVLAGVPVQAGLIISTGNNPQSNEENILFNDTGLIPEGNPVTGMTNNTSILVTFTGTETLVTPSSGQARVEALDGTLNYYKLALPGATFEDYIFNLNVSGTAPGNATIKLIAAGETLTGTFSIGNGENFFTVLATGGQRIASVEVTTDVSLTDVRQNRISGAEATPSETVPEASSALMLGGGLILFVLRNRKRS